MCNSHCVMIGGLLLLVSSCLLSAADLPLRDPTTPLGHRVAAHIQAVPSYTLHSVLISPQRKIATINGNSLREGQTLPGSAGVQVKRISPQRVVLQQADKTWELTLSPAIIRKH